jgi:hypothetical protein
MTRHESGPDRSRDVIVEHTRMPGDKGTIADRWVIFLGYARRAETKNPQGALVFARLLADLYKRPIWILHEGGEWSPVDARSIGVCSCC